MPQGFAWRDLLGGQSSPHEHGFSSLAGHQRAPGDSSAGTETGKGVASHESTTPRGLVSSIKANPKPESIGAPPTADGNGSLH